jgi:replication factor C small subunit
MEIQEIWTEKYRPRNLRNIIGQDYIVERLESFVKNRSLPHCLFAGPAGCGKTTAALAIARELFGNNWKSNFLELNASDERGIDTIRIKVKDFARTMALSGFKIIYLDEADSLTMDAQHALRRTMEKYTDTARFILAVNYISKIIAPIQSRTAVFRFSPLKEEGIIRFLKDIASNEKLVIDEAALKRIVYISEGDMRRAINILQTASVLGSDITADAVLAATGRADPGAVKSMIATAMDANFKEARSQLLSLLYERGISGEDIIKEVHNQIFALEISEEKRIQLLEKVGEYEFRLTEGSNPKIQLEALLAQIALVGKK